MIRRIALGSLVVLALIHVLRIDTVVADERGQPNLPQKRVLGVSEVVSGGIPIVLVLKGEPAREFFDADAGLRDGSRGAKIEISVIATLSQVLKDDRVRIQCVSPAQSVAGKTRMVTLTATVAADRIESTRTEKGTAVYSSPRAAKSGEEPAISPASGEIKKVILADMQGVEIRTWVVEETAKDAEGTRPSASTSNSSKTINGRAVRGAATIDAIAQPREPFLSDNAISTTTLAGLIDELVGDEPEKRAAVLLRADRLFWEKQVPAMMDEFGVASKLGLMEALSKRGTNLGSLQSHFVKQVLASELVRKQGQTGVH